MLRRGRGISLARTHPGTRPRVERVWSRVRTPPSDSVISCIVSRSVVRLMDMLVASVLVRPSTKLPTISAAPALYFSASSKAASISSRHGMICARGGGLSACPAPAPTASAAMRTTACHSHTGFSVMRTTALLVLRPL